MPNIKTAVIICATSELGKAVASFALHQKMKVVLVDDDEVKLQTLSQTLLEKNPLYVNQIFSIPLAIEKESIHKLILFIQEKVGLPDYLFNLFESESYPAKVWQIDNDKLLRELNKNFMSTFYCIRAFVPLLLESGKTAHIINLATRSEFVAQGNYGSDAVIGQSMVVLSECLHHDLGEHESKINVSVVCMGKDDLERAMDVEEGVKKIFEEITEKKFYIFLGEGIKDVVGRRLERFKNEV